ncbi:MAG: hypothetical protein K2Y71_15310 [Xanthobacteraceae bacterium]|nr:hypothetical protein [Xanthobacteraceae bacterium]
MCVRLITAAILLLALWVGHGRAAEPSLNEFLKDYDDPDRRAAVVANLSSIETALGWANSALRAQRMSRRALYCLPDNLTIAPHELISLLRDALWDEPRLGDRPIGFVVLVTLQRAFPCR